MVIILNHFLNKCKDLTSYMLNYKVLPQNESSAISVSASRGKWNWLLPNRGQKYILQAYLWEHLQRLLLPPLPINTIMRAWEMIQQVTVLAAKPEDLSSIPGTHVMDGQNQLLPSDLHIPAVGVWGRSNYLEKIKGVGRSLPCVRCMLSQWKAGGFVCWGVFFWELSLGI